MDIHNKILSSLSDAEGKTIAKVSCDTIAFTDGTYLGLEINDEYGDDRYIIRCKEELNPGELYSLNLITKEERDTMINEKRSSFRKRRLEQAKANYEMLRKEYGGDIS